MAIESIRKRSGEIAPFDRARIEQAIVKACDAHGETDRSFIPVVMDFVMKDLEQIYEHYFINRVPTVEDVQDLVERNLMKLHKFELAKKYIIYREHRKEERTEIQEKWIKKFENKTLKVTKADGSKEPFSVEKIKENFDWAAQGYEDRCDFETLIDAFKKNVVENLSTADINRLLVKTCLDLISVENIFWQEVAARFALGNLYKKATKNRKIALKDVYSPESYKALFDEYIEKGLYYKEFYQYYSEADIIAAGKRMRKQTDMEYTYTTVLSLAKRYLLNPNKVIKELPQEMYMSIALFLAIPEKPEHRLKFAFEVYEACSRGEISLPTPALLNSRTNYHQLSSCFKMSIDDDLRGIYHSIENIAQISKFGGGVGVYLGNIRCRGASIRGIDGASGGVVPWTKVMNDTAVAVNQLGARLGSVSVTLDIWHRDIYDFLDLQTETGDMRSKTFDIFPAISVPDVFMERVKSDGDWTLFDPTEITRLTGKKLQDSFGDEFTKFYESIEADPTFKIKHVIKAKDLFKKFLKTTVETGMPYVFFRDTVNRLNPNKHAGHIYSSQLCTEICQNTGTSTFIGETIEDGKIVLRYEPGDSVVCNLASVNVAKVNDAKSIARIFPILTRMLDNITTLSYYPIKEAEITSRKYRSIGIGYLGLAEYLATHGMAYDQQTARDHVNTLFAQYAYHTYRASVDLARDRGHYEVYPGSDYSQGIILGHDCKWFVKNTDEGNLWKSLFDDMAQYGVRFAYHTAPAPNTSTAGVIGTTAALLPIYKKYFVETNLSAPTVRVAPKLDASNFWLYKEYVHMDMNDVIDMMAVIYPWVDQSISFEWMIDPARVSPSQLYGYYLKAWEQGIKTVYYVRSLSGEVKKEDCVSCSG